MPEAVGLGFGKQEPLAVFAAVIVGNRAATGAGGGANHPPPPPQEGVDINRLKVDAATQKGALNLLPYPGPLPGDQGSQDAVGQDGSPSLVKNTPYCHTGFWVIPVAEHPHRPGESLGDRVKTPFLAPRTSRTVGGVSGIDEPGVIFPQGLVVGAQPLGNALSQVCEED